MILLVFIHLLITSCKPSNQETNNEPTKWRQPIIFNPYVPVLNTDQEKAFAALNELQVNSDEKNRLYSTFANVSHSCYPADTSFEITQVELLTYMRQFISIHYKKLDPESQERLANTSVLAEDHYTVFHCAENNSTIQYTDSPPMTGTWILPSVLGRRDITLVW